ncbi:MAG TPA: serine/threonine-protein kinase [Sphingomicrobium sp.]|nr:serine/threonine-protein kinase [Sphingomicrobium sp.]
MNRPYSNKALPAGTVLREWRIEEVLGVGGFGIVYKAKGIYFNELVAIKEYFPSAISERDPEDTVVPIDSEAEEVHALGLKKFVEEAKLLWNLSTPSRHPNIVSVRSLFEIHGTAYMVMDFEDGLSLSKMIKQGRRFNERSLWNILSPIAQGLDRAHRVGVLHRDIKPPNILINEDNRPVLIDFGSARFDTAEATSTKVTFHTPPYAAIEQYVRTYPQGPWTDIYALGVVMYECVTGEKPPEVLERLHAGLGEPLAEGRWPGYSKRFLSSVDAAMIVRPDERPQSISDWLPMFGRDIESDGDEADEATRFYAKQVHTEEIKPVPPTPNPDAKPVETRVPADPKEAKFKRAGEETGASKLKNPLEKSPAEPQHTDQEKAASAITPAAAKPGKGEPAATTNKRRSPALIASAAIAVLAVAGIAGFALRGGGSSPSPSASHSVPPLVTESPATVAALGPATTAGNSSANASGNAGTPQANQQAEANGVANDQSNVAEALRNEKAKTAAAEAQVAALKKAARAAAAPAIPGAPAAPTRKADRKSSSSAQTATAGQTGGVSPAKQAQFDATVEDARSMAKQAMHSSNKQNAQMAKNYDKYLKTLKDSMRGVQSDKEADKLIKEANQTRAYIQFLLRQN